MEIIKLVLLRLLRPTEDPAFGAVDRSVPSSHRTSCWRGASANSAPHLFYDILWVLDDELLTGSNSIWTRWILKG
jgi:hypothetical protein